MKLALPRKPPPAPPPARASASVQLLRYVLVGLVNTAIGFGCIYALMRHGLGDVAANALGYALGICLSYALNSLWTFGARSWSASSFARFLAVTGVAWAVNVAVLLAARDGLHLPSLAAQAAGMVSYTLTGFVGSRFFAFNHPAD